MPTTAPDSPPAKQLTWTREEFDRSSRDFMEHARKIFEDDKRHFPVFFIFGTKDPQTLEDGAHIIPVLAQFSSNEEKNLCAATVKTLARATRAVGLIFVTEAWIRQPEVTPDMKNMSPEQLREYWSKQKPPSECADREEVLMMHFEHVRFGAKAANATITRDAQNNPTLGDWVFLDGTLDGRFVHLLPQAD